MTDKTKQEELTRKVNNVFEVTRIDYEGVYEPDANTLLVKLINSEVKEAETRAYKQGWDSAGGELADVKLQVLQALEEVKSKQVEIFPCDCQFNKGFAYKKGDPCDGSCVLAPYRERVVSAIDEVERKYRNE